MGSHWSRKLSALGACADAVEWAKEQESFCNAWLSCERGDWMLWLAGKLSGKRTSPERRKLVLAASACARLPLPYVQKGELRPLAAIELAERFGRGEDIPASDLRAAAAAAAADAAAAAARSSTLKRCAEIVREIIKIPTLEK